MTAKRMIEAPAVGRQPRAEAEILRGGGGLGLIEQWGDFRIAALIEEIEGEVVEGGGEFRTGRSFLAARAGQGSPRPDPIFILGLPRSGSTLVEQILASHSQVEGTMELPDLIVMARRLGGKSVRRSDSAYPEILAELSPEALRELGEEFLERTRVQRKTDRPFFIDKMPNNFAHTGLIHLILPNAKIIDARRHPLDCCFSNYRQHFAKGQAFSYDLAHMGQYYADYVRAMAHFDAVAPGYVHRVIHEQLLDDPEQEIRKLLEYLGLPFEDACLNFHENKRAVRTASSESSCMDAPARATTPQRQSAGGRAGAARPVLSTTRSGRARRAQASWARQTALMPPQAWPTSCDSKCQSKPMCLIAASQRSS